MNASTNSRPVVVGPEQEAMDTAGAAGTRGLRADASTADATIGRVANSPTYADARFTADCMATFTRDRLRVVRPGSTEESDLRAIRGHLAIVGALFTSLMTEAARSEARACEAVGQGPESE